MPDTTITRETKLRDVLKTPAGHDILMKAFYSIGIREKVLTATPLGALKIGQLKRLSLGKLGDDFIDALLGLLNSEPELPLEDHAPVLHKWWKEAVFYQIYPRSFKDSNGDGIGDINGIIEKLDYLERLGVDAIWCSPVYDSPNDDNGYDIRDYRKIMQEFGTMADFDRLLSEVHARGMRLIMDLVINHSSDEHAWFRSSVSDPDSPYRDFYIWRRGRGENLPPNNWDSIFSGPAWNYYPERDEWALHLFSAKQMDFNWENEAVRRELFKIADWWLKKGIDGFRLDVISFISKKEGLPDGNGVIGSLMGFKGCEHYFYGPRLHQYLRELRENSFGKYDAFTVGECQGTGLQMSRLMTGDDRGELDVVFSFDHMDNPGKQRFQDYRFDLRPMAENLMEWQLHYGNHCWPTVFFENHDHPRMVSKIDPDGSYRCEIAKLLAMLQFTLKGTPFLYQGQELGMTNAPFESIRELRDVESINLYHQLVEKGKPAAQAFRTVLSGSRDHARTPMQWSGGENAGFSSGVPWLRVNPDYIKINAADEEQSVDSVLHFYRSLIALRKENPALIYGDVIPVKANPKGLLCYFRRLDGKRFYVELNLTGKPVKNVNTGPRGELLFSNYSTRRSSAVMRPYEANLYRD